MTKQEIIRKLETKPGQAFITKRELANAFGVTKVDHINKYVAGLERVADKYYFIPDVATAILERR